MPVISTWGAASFAGIRAGTTPQPRGGGGGADGDNNTYPGTELETLGGRFYNSGATYTATVTGLHRIYLVGAGGGGSDYAPGGAGGYAEAVVNLTVGEVCDISISAGGAYGASGGTGGAATTFTCLEGTISAGGGGGAGDQSASVGAQGTNGAAGTAGGDGGALAAGAGGNNFITSTLSYQVERGTTARVPSWSDGTVVDTGFPSASGGAIGAAGGEGKIFIQYSED